MPRRPKVFPDERRDWLERYERGQPLHKIAGSANADIRTIKKHIGIALEDRDRAEARSEIYREALKQHQGGLLNTIRAVREGLGVPHDEQLTTMPFMPTFQSPPVYVAGFSYYFSEGDLVRSDTRFAVDDDSRLFELAREHLPKDRFWKSLDEWEMLADEYLRCCYELGAKVGGEIMRRLSLKMFGESQGEGIHEGFVFWPCRLAIAHVLGAPDRYGEERPKIGDGVLRFGGSTVLTTTSREKLAQGKDLFQGLREDLQNNEMVKVIANLKTQLLEKLPPMKRYLGDLVLLGMIPGRCSVCKRLGF